METRHDPILNMATFTSYKSEEDSEESSEEEKENEYEKESNDDYTTYGSTRRVCRHWPPPGLWGSNEFRGPCPDTCLEVDDMYDLTPDESPSPVRAVTENAETALMLPSRAPSRTLSPAPAIVVSYTSASNAASSPGTRRTTLPANPSRNTLEPAEIVPSVTRSQAPSPQPQFLPTLESIGKQSTTPATLPLANRAPLPLLSPLDTDFTFQTRDFLASAPPDGLTNAIDTSTSSIPIPASPVRIQMALNPLKRKGKEKQIEEWPGDHASYTHAHASKYGVTLRGVAVDRAKLFDDPGIRPVLWNTYLVVGDAEIWMVDESPKKKKRYPRKRKRISSPILPPMPEPDDDVDMWESSPEVELPDWMTTLK